MIPKSILLIGMPGVGKSTVGKQLAKELNMSFLDLDKVISKKTNKSIQTLVNEMGDTAFMAFEAKAMTEIETENSILSPGGSIIYHDNLMKNLSKKTTIIYLENTLEHLEKHIHNIHTRGIIGLKNKTFSDLYHERTPLYEAYADITIHCQNKDWDSITKEVLNGFKTLPNN